MRAAAKRTRERTDRWRVFMRPGLMRGKIAIMLGHAQQPVADAGIFLALGLIGQLRGAFEKRFRIDHDRLQIRFRHSMIRKSAKRFSLATNAKGVCAEIMLKQKN